MAPKLDFSVMIRKLLYPVLELCLRFLWVASIVALAFLVYCLMKYHLKPWRVTREDLLRMRIRLKPANFIRWKLVDMMDASQRREEFREFGLTLYCGRQGSGKTISMVHYLNRMHRRYPKCKIVTNFEYAHADHRMNDWRDFFEIRNGEEGVIFAIDEIHSEYSAASWKDFPETLLAEISMQRKQRVKIVATSQVFTRVVKPIREQAFSVVLCSTFAGRWTRNREYDAADFEAYCDSPNRDAKIRPFWKTSFVQSDVLRRCYDTYEKIERMEKTVFLDRQQRGA